MFGEARKAAGVVERPRGSGHDGGVTGKLALRAEPPIHPKERGVERKQHQPNLLQQVDPVVPPAEVFLLMQHDLAQIRCCKFSGEALRKEQPGREEADHAWRLYVG
jgi:hypothetical protein